MLNTNTQMTFSNRNVKATSTFSFGCFLFRYLLGCLKVGRKLFLFRRKNVQFIFVLFNLKSYLEKLALNRISFAKIKRSQTRPTLLHFVCYSAHHFYSTFEFLHAALSNVFTLLLHSTHSSPLSVSTPKNIPPLFF